VSGRLDAAGAGRATAALVAALAKATGPERLNDLRYALRAVGERLTTDQLLDALGHPLAAGPAERELLALLGQRTRRTFRSTWHFLDWARSNGVDFTPPGLPPR
jgi:hypothetical protein